MFIKQFYDGGSLLLKMVFDVFIVMLLRSGVLSWDASVVIIPPIIFILLAILFLIARISIWGIKL